MIDSGGKLSTKFYDKRDDFDLHIVHSFPATYHQAFLSSGRRRLLNPENLVVLLAGPISHTSIQYMDFVKIFNVSLDLSIIYFANFSGC